MATILIKLSELIFSKRVTHSLLYAIEAYLEAKAESAKMRRYRYFAKNSKEMKNGNDN